jgi:hypothetical protein
MSGILNQNLQALSRIDPALASRLASCAPSPEVSFKAAGNGAIVPSIRDAGHTTALHSGVDPQREGQRVYRELGGAGFMVFIGLGAAYHILPLLDDPGVAGALVIEKELSFIRSILENVDLTRLLRDPRVQFLVDPAPGAIESALISAYLPAVMGNMKSFPLRSMRYRCGFSSSVSEEIIRARDRIGSDLAAQARFGKRWVSNTLANLPYAAAGRFTPSGRRTVWIVAAGPSLDLQIPQLRARGMDTLLVSTDTALPALLSRGIRPDAAISIDCQHYGYHHYLSSCTAEHSPSGIPFLLDISSPPALVRAAKARVFFAGGHPLSRFIRRHWMRLPVVDTSGGNVAYAALSVAQCLGAGDISLFGLDYSYPDGKPYARGTYLPVLFDSRSYRLFPSDSSYAALVFGGKDAKREPICDGWRYSTPLLHAYHAGMQALISATKAAVTVAPGRGLDFSSHSERQPGCAVVEPWETPDPPKRCWREFLRDYRTSLAALPVPENPAAVSIRKLPEAERDVWLTLLPLVPCLEAEGRGSGDRARLLEDARNWTISRIDRTLETAGL